MNTKGDEIYEAIKSERRKQDNERWGVEFDDLHTINDWVTFINRYVAKAAPMRDDNDDHVLAFTENLVKAAAIIFAALEAEDRNGGLPERHYDSLEKG